MSLLVDDISSLLTLLVAIVCGLVACSFAFRTALHSHRKQSATPATFHHFLINLHGNGHNSIRILFWPNEKQRSGMELSRSGVVPKLIRDIAVLCQLNTADPIGSTEYFVISTTRNGRVDLDFNDAEKSQWACLLFITSRALTTWLTP